MREGMVRYDARGREIWACPNVDARATEAVAELIQSQGSPGDLRSCRDWVAITAPARFRWIARHEPETFGSIAHVGMLGDWILHRLSGAYVTDPSLGSSSGMFELAERDWSRPIIEMCGLERSVFPEVLAPGTVVGAVTRDAAASTGLRQGTPVTVGVRTPNLGLVGIGVVEPGRFTVVGGSFWQHTVLLDEPLIDPAGRLRTLCHTSPGQWMMEGIGFYSGLTMRWFRDAFCAAEKRQCEIDGSDVYELLEADAASVAPGSNGGGRHLLQPDGRQALGARVTGLHRLRHLGAGALGPGAVHGRSKRAPLTCLGHMRIVQELIGRAVDSAVFTGGGAKGSLWARILADVLGVPLAIPEVKESSALGAAMYAATAIGAYADIDEALTAIVRYERSVEPDPVRHREYEALYEAWRTLYAGALELSEARLSPALLRAPGTGVDEG